MRTNDSNILLAIKVFGYFSIIMVYIAIGLSSKRKKVLADYMRIPYKFNQSILKNYKRFNKVQGNFHYLAAIIIFVFFLIDIALYHQVFSIALYVSSLIISAIVLVFGMIIWDRYKNK